MSAAGRAPDYLDHILRAITATTRWTWRSFGTRSEPIFRVCMRILSLRSSLQGR